MNAAQLRLPLARLLLFILPVTLVPVFTFAAEQADHVERANTEIAELRSKADPWLASNDDVAVRKSSADLFRLIDALIAQGAQSDAEPYLVRVLKADPRAFEYQLIYGEILAHKGHPEALKARTSQAIQYAEDDATIRRAYQLSNQTVPASVPPFDGLRKQEPELVLLKLDNEVSEFWIFDLRDALAQKLGFSVRIARVTLDEGEPDRNGLDVYIAQTRTRLLEATDKDPGLMSFLTARQITKESIAKNDATVLRVVRLISNQTEDPQLARELDAHFEKMRQSDLQWKGDRLLNQLDQVLSPSKQPAQWFLGVTGHDIYADRSNFVFGVAQTNASLGIISTARFTAKFSGDTQKRDRLISRLLKQALSSYGFMLGVPRCSNPDCARSYPHSLPEHDMKPEVLCSDCRERFEKALDRKLPPGPVSADTARAF